MSFGYSLGDVVLVSQLAWKAYKACKQAPDSFAALSQEALSLHAVLRELEESLTGSSLPAAQQDRLKIVCDGCQAVLTEILALVGKYESLATSSQRAWDRMRFGAEDITELRSRLVSSTVLLTAFVANTQIAIEQKLRKLVREIQNGHRESSIVSVQTIDSLSADEQSAWRDIRKALQDIGVTPTAFEQNKDFILRFLRDLMVSGELQELAVIPTPASEPTMLDNQHSNTQTSRADAPQHRNLTIAEDTMKNHFFVLKEFYGQRIQEFDDGRPPGRAYEKLVLLSSAQFQELSTDVYDEYLRRNAKQLDPNTPDALPHKGDFHPKRNMARNKLSTLAPNRFQKLGTEVFFEFKRRFPHFDRNDMGRGQGPGPGQSSAPIGSPVFTGLLAPVGSESQLYGGDVGEPPQNNTVRDRPVKDILGNWI